MAEDTKPDKPIKTVPGGRVILDDMTRRCLECNEPLTQKYFNNMLYYTCPNGCGRWAPNPKVLRVKRENAVRMILSKRSCTPEPIAGGSGGRGKGKGGSKSGRKRKKPVKRKKPWEW